MRSLLLALTMMFATASPAVAFDRTTYLLQLLEQCDPRTVWQTGPRLDVLLALADGRSAVELAGVLAGRHDCIGSIATYGEGATEVVVVGSRGVVGAKGAMLWVDRGYWRIAAVPTGYTPAASAPMIRDDGREYLLPYWSGGSAGMIGLVAVLVSGPVARTTLSFMPGGEIGAVQVLLDGRLYVEGRVTSDRALTWSTHPDWPGGAQWLFERRSGLWVEVAHRQVISPHYLLTGLIGGLRQGDPAMMSRFASPDVVAQALALPAPGTGYLEMHGSYDLLLADYEVTREETAAWDALPNAPPAPSPRALYRTITFPGVRDVPGPRVEVRFDRDASGWRIAWVRPAAEAPRLTNELVP